MLPFFCPRGLRLHQLSRFAVPSAAAACESLPFARRVRQVTGSPYRRRGSARRLFPCLRRHSGYVGPHGLGLWLGLRSEVCLTSNFFPCCELELNLTFVRPALFNRRAAATLQGFLKQATLPSAGAFQVQVNYKLQTLLCLSHNVGSKSSPFSFPIDLKRPI
ncbi:hypothetical protein L6164_023703 [Bauhinia variegata]|uniref:Uncharacterized protein n=1 Tax=Bauhinia variegata TaxID=167791 RepID=A0ACB9MJG3_BAUVA|nr:hypothetical protein L6164_023703 [Bauhinia variegata]